MRCRERSDIGLRKRLQAVSLALVLMLTLTGCSRTAEPVPSQAAAAHQPEQQNEANTVVRLDATARKQAGIVVEQVGVRSLPQVVRATGRISNDETRTWRVGALTDGRIVRIYAQVGERVQEGQVLARMHSHDIHESRAMYARALSDLDRARAFEAHARRVRDRQKTLYDLKAGSQEQSEAAEAELKNASNMVTNAEIEVDRTRSHLLQYLRIPLSAPPHVEGKDEPDEDLIPIAAPATGTLLVRNVTPGTVVQPSSDLFVVSDLQRLWMLASANEEYLPRLREGLPVRVFVQAYPGSGFPGRIRRLGEALDATTRTVTVQVELANPGGRLKPEMYATAEIELGDSQPALFIPQEATQEMDGRTVVFVCGAGDVLEARAVETGRLVDGVLEVVSGLTPGESLVTRGSFIVKSQMLRASMAEE
jgi:membrane fusion protein, heavy metal efflux system